MSRGAASWCFAAASPAICACCGALGSGGLQSAKAPPGGPFMAWRQRCGGPKRRAGNAVRDWQALPIARKFVP